MLCSSGLSKHVFEAKTTEGSWKQFSPVQWSTIQIVKDQWFWKACQNYVKKLT